MLFRSKKVANPHHKIAHFGPKTGTGTLQNYLCSTHAHKWIDSCDSSKIKIMAKSAQEVVTEYRAYQGQGYTSSGKRACRPYSSEAFVDAIVEFIVADQVHIYLVTCEGCTFLTVSLHRPSMLLSANSCGISS